MSLIDRIAGPCARWLSQFVSRSLDHRAYPLDALRGLAIVGMVLVNGAPPTDSIYAPLVHAMWHGWTLADTVFPMFLFVVGVSIAFAVKRPVDREGAPPAGVHWKIARRALLLFAIGVVLVNFPYYEPYKLQLTGVLAHIAVCYLVVALLHLHTGWRTQLALIPAVWLIHWAVLTFLKVPGFGAGELTPLGNAARFVDQMLLGPHSHSFYAGETETSGVLAIFSSVSSTLIGLLAGRYLRSARDLPTRISGMFAAGFLLFMLGNAWNWILPVNKQLWTGSYVALTSGLSLGLLATAYWLMEMYGRKAWAKPLQIAGVNALAFYVLAAVVQRLLVYGRISGSDGLPVQLRQAIYEQLVAPWIPGKPGALVFAFAILLLCFAIAALLYREKIFFKL